MVRINYSKNHYCKTCALLLPLDVFNCPECGMKVRIVPRKQKRTAYIPVPENERYINTKKDIQQTFMTVKVQCKTTNPYKEHRY